MSAAKAISDHMHDFVCGSDGRVVSMAVCAYAVLRALAMPPSAVQGPECAWLHASLVCKAV